MKNLALVAHDNCKPDLVEWVRWNSSILIQHNLICTGTTGRLVESALREKHPNINLSLKKLKSGPLGGDFQLGAMIVEGMVDLLIFMWDPTEPHQHDVDVKALLRISVLHNIAFACNKTSADYLISSPLFIEDYQPKEKDFTSYENRDLPVAEDLNTGNS